MNFDYFSPGKANRLNQIFKPSKKGQYRTVLLAVDHPYYQGFVKGLDKETIRSLVPYADAVSPARGTLIHYLDPNDKTPIILRATGRTSITRKEELSNEGIAVTAEETERLRTEYGKNIIGVSASVFIDSDHQKQTLGNLCDLVNTSSRFDHLVLGITAVGPKLEEMRKDEEAFSTYLAHSGRIIEEHGADILKTYYCKGFDKIREAVEIPIVIAGGKKMPERKALQMVYRAVKAGANGGDLGRNVFKADYPIGIMQAINSIVHEGSTLKASIELYEHLKHTRDN